MAPLTPLTVQEMEAFACGKDAAVSTELLMTKGAQLVAPPLRIRVARAAGKTVKFLVMVSVQPFSFETTRIKVYEESIVPELVRVHVGFWPVAVRVQLEF